MALTTEQQSQLEFNVAMQEATAAQDSARRANEVAAQAKQAKLEAIRLAKDVLIENARSKAVDSRDVTAADITAFADTLIAYVNA
jgi:hypothetical protein